MSDAPFINFYTSDFLAGTSGMTAATKGVYITLLCLLYEGEKPLGQSWDALARRCGCTLPAFRRAVDALIEEGKVEVSDDGKIWSKKVERHITLRRERQSSARAAAKTRWKKSKEKQGRADATAGDPQCDRNANQNQSQTSVEDKSSTGAVAPLDPEKVMFDSGRELLMAAGLSKQKAGSVLGRFKKDYGTEAVIAAIGRARRENAQNPVEFMQGVFKWERKGGKPQVGDTRKLSDGRVQEYAGGVEGWMEVHG